MFVHSRAKLYSANHDLRVYSLNNNINLEYKYDGIDVVLANDTSAFTSILNFDPDVIFVHTPTSKWQSLGYDTPALTNKLYEKGIPYAVWIHGQEALVKSVYYPIARFDRKLPFPADLGRFPLRLLQLLSVRTFLNKTQARKLPVVFVSEWLRNAVSKSLLMDFRYSEIIPNPIDTNLFTYNRKERELSTKLLSIRPFKPKYAVEDSIRAISKVTGVHLDLFGEGPGYEKYQELIEVLDADVKLHKGFLQPAEIASLHKNYGVYLSPSRTDSQGVSMCEAMASGLTVISSDIQGIPEFVKNGSTGFLTDSPEQMSSYIRYLRDHPSKMQEIGKNASLSIQKKSGEDVVLDREISLAESLVRNFVG
jgi:glycosyltransferase involved in cell wall biosynthesis